MNTLVFEGQRSQDSETYGGFQKIGGGSPQIIHFLIGFSIINHPFWGTPILGNPHIGIVALWGIFWFKKKQQLEVAARKESGLQWNHLWLQPPSLWSLLAQRLCCQLFHLFQEETHHASFDKGGNLSLGSRRSPRVPFNSAAFDSASEGCFKWPAWTTEASFIFNKSPGVFGGEKTGSKLSINYAMIPKSEGWFLFFGCSPFFFGGGGWGWKGVNFRGFTQPIDSTKTSFRNEDMCDMRLALKKDL